MRNSFPLSTSLVRRASTVLALLVLGSLVAGFVHFSAWFVMYTVGVLLLVVASGTRTPFLTVFGGASLALGIGSLVEVVFGVHGVLFAALGVTLILAGTLFPSWQTPLMASGLAALVLGVIVHLYSLGFIGYVIGSLIVALILITIIRPGSELPPNAPTGRNRVD